MANKFEFKRYWFESINCLENDSQKLELFNAICDYALNKKDHESELSSVSKAIFINIKPKIKLTK